MTTPYRTLTIEYPFIRHIPIAIAKSISRVSNCAMMCGGRQRKRTRYCFQPVLLRTER